MMPPSFVKTSGTRFTVDGKPIYIAGCNNYYLSYKSDYMVEAVLDGAQTLGLNVIRTWGSIVAGSSSAGLDPPGHKDGIYFQYWDSSSASPAFNDGPKGLERLDYVVHAAGRRGLKLVLPLVNNWKDFGGIDQYLDWYGLQHHDNFYTSPDTRQAYKNWVLHLLNRANVFTGVLYRNDPTIMAWELANEPRCQGSGGKPASPTCTTRTLLSWAAEMSSFIKVHDSSHLVGVGDEGFFNRSFSIDWLYNGSQGVDFEAFLALPTIDFGSFHLYPETWNKPAGWARHWIEDHLAAGAKAGKPVLLEEYGLKDSVARNREYESWLEAMSRGGGAGDLFWMLAAQQDDRTPYPDYDGFTLYGDSIVPVLRAHAAAVSSGTQTA